MVKKNLSTGIVYKCGLWQHSINTLKLMRAGILNAINAPKIVNPGIMAFRTFNINQ